MHQKPGAFASLGITMIAAGIVFVSTGTTNAGRGATLSALATGATIAAYTVADGLGIQRSQSTLSYAAWVFASYLLTPFVIMLRSPVSLFATTGFHRAAVAGFLSLAAYALVLWATRHLEVGIVSALRETSVLWAVVLGRVFLGEVFTWRRMFSAIIICLGIALTVLRST